MARIDFVRGLARQLQGPPAQPRRLGADAERVEQRLGPEVLVDIQVKCRDALGEWTRTGAGAASVSAGPNVELRQLVEPVH